MARACDFGDLRYFLDIWIRSPSSHNCLLLLIEDFTVSSRALINSKNCCSKFWVYVIIIIYPDKEIKRRDGSFRKGRYV